VIRMLPLRLTVSVSLSLSLSLCVTLALAAPVAGAAESATPATLTLDQALAMARKRSPNLTVERARLAQAQTNIEQAWSALFPTLALQGKYTHNDREVVLPFGPVDPATMLPTNITIQPQEQLDAAINATMPLIAPPAYPALEAVKSSVHASEANFEASEAQVLFTVAQAFYAAAIADEVLLARKSSVQVARATLDNARTRFSAGTVTKVDVDRAELAFMRAEQQNREAVTAREQTYRSLATLIHADGPFQVAAPPPAAVKADAQSMDLAMHLRPEFRALEETVRSSEAQRRAYKWRWAPTLSAFGQARAFNYKNFAGQQHVWLVGAQLDWVIFDGGVRDAQRHLAAAQADEAMARAEVLRDSVGDDLVNGQRSLETKQKAVETAERSVSLARETLELVRVQYEAGSVTQVDLLQAQDGLVAVQESLAQAHFDVAVTDLTLRRAAGTFPGK
jgi:protease secretion system outer membrane protein